ncbi:MAG: beta-glucosidase [Actinomycetota bacterium]|nr:beta-glucosidase [Actinomycetota bacterium]
MTITFPEGFDRGVASAAHQIEGGNWNNDWWAWEHAPGTACVEVSGDACDSLNRYAEDIALVRDFGFDSYRFSIEWSRIEPEDGEFSRAALDYYRRVLAACHENGIAPAVTFHHFTTPRWMAARGGWAEPEIVDRFGRFCERAVEHLGDLISLGCTINEPNVVSLLGYVMGTFPPGLADFSLYAKASEHLRDAHVRAYDVIKAGPGDFPVGLTVSMSDWWTPEGGEAGLERARAMHEDYYLDATRGNDFVGVQAYTRTRIGLDGLPMDPEPGTPIVESMNYEYWPQSLEASIRHAIDVSGAPVYVTENGIGTDDDPTRISYVTEALQGVGRCLSEGLDVRGYTYWSLLDNFEWAEGYTPRFGLVAVDRETFVRTPKPSAAWLGAIAKAGRLDP